MSKLYGKVSSDNGRTVATRAAHKEQTVWIQTEYGRITVTMSADGDYWVSREAVSGYTTTGGYQTIAKGNANNGTRIC